MRREVNATGVVIAIVLAVMAYALMHDLLDGLPFTRSTSSWGSWGAGLLVFGLVAIAIESAFEWFFGPDEPWRRGPRRMMRVAVALVLLTLLVAAVGVMSK